MSNKTKLLFIDRDGTLIYEPSDYQVDTIGKLKFYPEAISMLSRIANELDYQLVMVTNQDGLGTPTYPHRAFDEVQAVVLDVFTSVGATFSAVHVDPTFPSEQSPNRKPGIGMLTEYFSDKYDLASSFVIGDRITDVELAKNLGCSAIWLNDGTNLGKEELSVKTGALKPFVALETLSWKAIYEFLRFGTRSVSLKRTTRETDISVNLNLDGTGKASISTGIGFYDHMLELFAKHSGVNLELAVKGDLYVDEHHTVEDAAIVLGEAFAKALGNKAAINRYAFELPMDESGAKVLLDFGGRAHLEWDAVFKREKIGDLPTELIKHFFKSFTDGARCNLHVAAKGENEHHIAEAMFKALARAVKTAIRRDISQSGSDIPSTKGVL